MAIKEGDMLPLNVNFKELASGGLNDVAARDVFKGKPGLTCSSAKSVLTKLG